MQYLNINCILGQYIQFQYILLQTFYNLVNKVYKTLSLNIPSILKFVCNQNILKVKLIHPESKQNSGMLQFPCKNKPLQIILKGHAQQLLMTQLYHKYHLDVFQNLSDKSYYHYYYQSKNYELPSQYRVRILKELV